LTPEISETDREFKAGNMLFRGTEASSLHATVVVDVQLSLTHYFYTYTK
jgi:hypothetical protein